MYSTLQQTTKPVSQKTSWLHRNWLLVIVVALLVLPSLVYFDKLSVQSAFREKNVIIVSPTTFMAYLQTVLQGLRALQIEEQTKEIQIRVGQLGRHIATYDTYMQKLGSSLGTTVNHFNTAHKELKKIDKDVVKIAQNNPAVEPMLLERPNVED